MDSPVTVVSGPDESTEMAAAIDRIIEEIKALHVRMQEDQAEIDRIKADRERIQAECEALKVSTQAILATLRTGL